MSEPAVVFGDGKAVAGAHRGACEGLLQSHDHLWQGQPLDVWSLLSPVLGAPAPVKVTWVWMDSVGGGEQRGEGRQFLAPAVTARVGGGMLCHQGVTPAWLCL